MARGKGAARQAQQARRGGEEEAPYCPLCIEPLDNYEQSWYPCPCGYQICSFCRGRIRLENDNKCPGCRTEYDSNKDPFQKVEHIAKASPARAQPKAAPRRVANGVHSPHSPTGDSDDTGAIAARAPGSPPLANGSAQMCAASKESTQRPDPGLAAPLPGQAQEQQSSASSPSPAQSSRQSSPEDSGAEQISDPDEGAPTQHSEGSKVPQRSQPQDASPYGSLQRQQSSEIGSAGSSANGVPAKQPADDLKATTTGSGPLTAMSVWAQSSQLPASRAPGTPTQHSTAQRAEAIGVISPTSWPNLSSTPPPPAPKPPTAPSRSKSSGEQSPAGSLSQAFQRMQTADSGKAGEAGKEVGAVRALWDSMLPSTPAEPDVQGSALREQVYKAVSEGELSTREGASRLVSYINSKEAAMKLPQAPVRPHASPAMVRQPGPPVGSLLAALQRGSSDQKEAFLAQKSQELANGFRGLGEFPYPHYPNATSNGHGIGGLGGSRDASYGIGLGDSRQDSGAWLQSGLGMSVGSGSGQLGSMSDLWGRSNKLSPSPSIWASQRLDADVVPEPLQELWAKPPEASSVKQQRGPFGFGSNRTSSDSLASGFSGVAPQEQQHTLGSSYGRSDSLLRPPLANGFTSGYGQGLGLGYQLHTPQAPSLGLGLGDQYSLWSSQPNGSSQLGGGNRSSQGQGYDLGQRFDNLGSGLYQH